MDRGAWRTIYPQHLRTSLVAQMVRNLPAMRETQVQSLSWKDALEKGMATHSRILAWRTPWTEEPGGLQVQSLSWKDALEKGMATHSRILAWRTPWTEEPGGLQSVGSQRVGHNWATNTLTTLVMIHGCQGLGREKWTGGTQTTFRAVKWLCMMMDICHYTCLQTRRMYSTKM